MVKKRQSVRKTKQAPRKKTSSRKQKTPDVGDRILLTVALELRRHFDNLNATGYGASAQKQSYLNQGLSLINHVVGQLDPNGSESSASEEDNDARTTPGISMLVNVASQLKHYPKAAANMTLIDYIINTVKKAPYGLYCPQQPMDLPD